MPQRVAPPHRAPVHGGCAARLCVLTMKATATAHWSERRERSNPHALRFMAWIAVFFGRGVARLILHVPALYFMLSGSAWRRHSQRYLTRALGRRATWLDSYRHVYTFATTVLDRIYFVRGRTSRFDITVSGDAVIDAGLAEGRGALLLGAHLGSFEVLHAIGDARPGVRVAMVMYPENARMIHGVLKAVAPDFELGIIPIGRSGSALAVREWLDGGGLAGLLGDRFLEGDAARKVSAGGVAMLPFLGHPAPWSLGPLRLAQLLRHRVFFMAGLYFGGRRYEVRMEELCDFRQPLRDPREREAQLHAALAAYVARLEALCHEVPYNWFNFHDFWHEERPQVPAAGPDRPPRGFESPGEAAPTRDRPPA